MIQSDGVRGDLLITVLPTGGGKSILFILPALMDDANTSFGSTSIIIIPFVTLAKDLITRTREFDIDYFRQQQLINKEQYVERKRDAQLVVVSVNQAVTNSFMTYIESIRSQGQLKRIFINKCHIVITDISYRKRLEQLIELHRFDCTIVMLITTLLINIKKQFRKQILANEAVIIRAYTTKRNIRYRVKRVKPGKATVEDRIVAEMLELKGLIYSSQKGVIYCRSIYKCEAFANKVKYGYYHNKLPIENH